ncbi:MAG: PQQ-dependent sugar dehydrogenase [Pseudomonadales bacterium]|nr:PQQ-dependent sugar dehydrogenase [Pseudomonadales bacterium]
MINMLRQSYLSVLAFLLLLANTAYAQFEGPALGNDSWVFDTYEQDGLEVSVLAHGLDHPFGLSFIPGTATDVDPLGDVLITERNGKVRLFRQGRLVDAPVMDMKTAFPLQQLFDIERHPRFSNNGLLYFTWIKQSPHPDGTDKFWATTALARGRWDGEQLLDLEEVFEAKAWSDNICGASSRLHFLADGSLLFGVSHRCDEQAPQRLDSHIGKILRLNDDGSVPRDNPFIAVEGALPEIYNWGNRSVMDFATHPETGEIWELENGPQGGDEVNILAPGQNYGWPLATFGRDYDGTRFSPQPWVEGTQLPEVFWVPSITVAGLTFYTGTRFPKWQGNLFVTSMIMGRVPGTGHLERIVFNEQGEIRREQLLTELHQRIRYVMQGPDELLYLLTDHSDGMLLRLAPASMMVSDAGSRPASESTGEIPLFPDQDCSTCHRIEDPLVGPSYREIARRYPRTDANIARLAARIIEGGANVWGEVPMTPHTDLPAAVATEMAAQILTYSD